MMKKFTLFLLALALTLSLCACGGGQNQDLPPENSAAAPASDQETAGDSGDAQPPAPPAAPEDKDEDAVPPEDGDRKSVV